MSHTYCPTCYCRKVYCRKCGTTHCRCSWSQCRSTRLLHKGRSVRIDHGTITTTLCGRNRTGNDGMNIAGPDEAVTCKLCLRMMNR